MMIAPQLRAGDRVGIAAPSGFVRSGPFLQGVRVLEEWGLKPVFRQQLFSRHRYFAGSHRRRLRELQLLIDRDDIGALLFPRGGFGLHHILPQLKLSRLRRFPKRIIGYSDLTMLLERIRSEIGLVTYYGPTVWALGARDHSRVRQDYRRILLGAGVGPKWRLSKTQILRQGRGEGELMGGCLTLLSMSIGTSFEIETRNRILLLEDINEPPYRFERLLLHLKQSGKLKNVRGLVISAHDAGRMRTAPREWKTMIKEVLADFRGPIVFGFRWGHMPNPHTLPLGMRARLDTYRGELILLNS